MIFNRSKILMLLAIMTSITGGATASLAQQTAVVASRLGALTVPAVLPQVTFYPVDTVITDGSITFGFDVTAFIPKSDDWVAIVRKSGSWLALRDGDYVMTLGASAGTLTLAVPLSTSTAAEFDIVYYQNAAEPYMEMARHEGITVPRSTASKDPENAIVDSSSLSPLRYQEFKPTEVIGRLTDVIVENFFDEAVARRSADRVAEHLSKGDYDDMSAAALARLLTEHLVDVSNDSHYRIIFDPEQFDFLSSVGRAEFAENPEVRARKAKATNFGFTKLAILPGNIGYLQLDGFNGEPKAVEKAYAAMMYLEDCEELIIDLRDNGGGEYEVEEALVSYFFPAEPKIHLNNYYFRDESRNMDNWTRDDLPGKRLLDQHVFVVTSESTYSAAESLAYRLKVHDRATIVGEPTSGGANWVNYFPLVQGFVAKVPVGQDVDAITGTSWDGVGLEPDVPCAATEAIDRAHILALERRLIDCDDSERSDLQYLHDRKRAKVLPATISHERKTAMAGEYGNAKVAVLDDSLSLQVAGISERWMKLYPLTEEIFMVDKTEDARDDFRVTFGGSENTSNHVQLMFDDGRVIKFARSE